MPVYNGKYIKTEVREFNSVIKRNLLSDEILKEGVHYTCIAYVTIDSVMRMKKKKKKKSTSLLRMQIKNKEDNNV